jgi:hypothetical protein
VNWQAAPVPYTPVARYIAQTSNILRHLTSKLTFNNTITVNSLSYSTYLIFREFAGSDCLIDAGLLQNHICSTPANTVNIRKRYPHGLIVWNINTNYTRHNNSC